MEIKIIVDLRDQFVAIRDQGTRPTCMAFAASDAHSFARGSAEALSAEYAFFQAVRRTASKDRTKGVSLRLMSQTISHDGQPGEIGWPYLSNLSTTDKWEPPDNPGTIFCRKTNLLGADVASVYSNLDACRPVILVINISQSFLRATPGTVLRAPANEPRINTHAVVALGYGESEGERCLLIRNSWGKGWCDAGYAWVHEDYLKLRLRDAGVMA